MPRPFATHWDWAIQPKDPAGAGQLFGYTAKPTRSGPLRQSVSMKFVASNAIDAFPRSPQPHGSPNTVTRATVRAAVHLKHRGLWATPKSKKASTPWRH